MLKLILVSFIASSISCVAFASHDEGHKKEGDHPCMRIKKACEGAGFVKGGHKKDAKKGLYKDCMEPIMAGQTVAGVKIEAADIDKCKEKKAHHKEHGEHGEHGHDEAHGDSKH